MRESEVRAEHIRATLKSLYTTMVQKSNDLKVLSPAHQPYKKAAALIQVLYLEQIKLQDELEMLADQKIALAEKAYNFQLIYTSQIEKRMKSIDDDEQIREQIQISEIRRQQEIEIQIYQSLCRTSRKKQIQRDFESNSSVCSNVAPETKDLDWAEVECHKDIEA